MNPIKAIFSSLGIGGSIAAVLGVMLLAAGLQIRSLSSNLEDKRNELATERAGHALTRQSVGILQTSLEKFVGAGRAARIAQLASVEAQAKKSADQRAKAESIRAMIDSLEPDEACRTPDFVMGN